MKLKLFPSTWLILPTEHVLISCGTVTTGSYEAYEAYFINNLKEKENA